MGDAFARRIPGRECASWLALEYTMFSDKRDMVVGSGTRLDFSKKKLVRTFDRAEKLRNWCAHTSADEELSVDSIEDLKSLVKDTLALSEALFEAAARNVPASDLAT